mmetsp:Transcript_28076/g.61606  ORF Transcript_28076/g.61606 Transcript_28076/m.61606 type:complete len:526 (+) Transcript_28076:899-2476(+)|eukprot:CAMPEP_0178483508 /NCGR_PEP_ID=MMETSP0696-20121128/7273_1 /TAXON_ID=265572 /ORGANISM="Extubocellulus spinifer, Strain CCMP396" /LENGTH=525 /DNA_ID=CAMNT_0020111033 /DNA_START=2254 /DNA_END=3831 /DNA_ORIENTATION=+
MIDAERKPITNNDIVTVRGQYLFIGQNRFFMKGIAFPTPPPHTSIDDDDTLDLSGWNAVLEQLASETYINTIRVYEMDCRKDYGPFLDRAAELGIYVIVPLTGRSGDGVLSRDAVPPKCYPRKLYKYGAQCINRYWTYPNVIAGVVGNEVMNNLLTWQSAPCVKAYLNDLAAYIRSIGEDSADTRTTRTSLPLMYATQHDSPGAELHADEAMKLTLDYLACNNGGSIDSFNDFIFGINIESWCSSLQTFEYEEDGVSESSYHSLWKTLSGFNKTKALVDPITGNKTFVDVPPVSSLNVTAPIVFSEMGCSKDKFNHDNSLQPKFVRDWKQVKLVMEGGPMTTVFSGFVSYGYDGGGNPFFRMMGGKNNWDGKHPLPSSPDYDNFRHELSKAIDNAKGYDGRYASEDMDQLQLPPSSCDQTVETLERVWGLELYTLSKMPSYSSGRSHFLLSFLSTIGGGLGMTKASGDSRLLILGSFALLLTITVAVFIRHRNKAYEKKMQQISTYEGSEDERGLLLTSEKLVYS